MSRFPVKEYTLMKELDNVMYQLMVRTNSDMVDCPQGYTLTEKLCQIAELFTKQRHLIRDLRYDYDKIMGYIPTEEDDKPNDGFQSFVDVWNYVNINGDPKSELIKLIESKQAMEEDKGLSHNDLTDVLYEKLVNDYNAEELSQKFNIVVKTFKEIKDEIFHINSQNNIYMTKENNMPEEISDGDIWYQIMSIDEGIDEYGYTKKEIPEDRDKELEEVLLKEHELEPDPQDPNKEGIEVPDPEPTEPSPEPEIPFPGPCPGGIEGPSI